MFGIRGFEYRRTDYHEGSACFQIEQSREKYRCPEWSGVWFGGGQRPGAQGAFAAIASHRRPVDVRFALTPFWKRLRAPHAKVRAVTTDLSKGYIKAVRENLPKAIHVFDHFHVIKLYNDKLSAFRRDLYRELTTEHERRILKGTRWLLLKNPENLDEERNERERLADALALNTPLTTVYYMKDDLRQVWDQASKAPTRRVLDDWIRRAEASGLSMLKGFAANSCTEPS